jgi:acyl carrier protein
MSSELRIKLRDFIKKELARGHGDVDVETAALVDNGIIDSLGIMKLVQFIERECGVRIGDEELIPDNFENLEAILRLISGKRRVS